MARGVNFEDAIYTLDNGLNMLARTDRNWIAADRAGAVAAGAVIDIPAHVKVSANVNEFGIHPRYVRLYREIGAAGDGCVLQNATKTMTLVILTKARFDQLIEYTPASAADANSTINLSHKPGGGDVIQWRVGKKVGEKLV
jgi:hypothetical protein